MNRSEKNQLVSEVSDKFQQAAAVFLTEYRGLTVAEMTSVRRDLRAANAEMKVVKNRLVKLALDDEKRAALEDRLKGPVALTFAMDEAVSVAKVLAKYQKEFEPLEITGGVLNGDVLDKTAVIGLSKLPSKEELYAKLLGTLMAPVTNVVRAMQGVSTNVVRALAAIRDTKTE